MPPPYFKLSTSKVSATTTFRAILSRLSTQLWCQSFPPVCQLSSHTFPSISFERKRATKTWVWPSWTHLWRDLLWSLEFAMTATFTQHWSSDSSQGSLTYQPLKSLKNIESMILSRLCKFTVFAGSWAFSTSESSGTTMAWSQRRKALSNNLGSKS